MKKKEENIRKGYEKIKRRAEKRREEKKRREY